MARAEYPDTASAPCGMVGLWIDPQGRVIAHTADFERQAPGGFKLHEAQEHRARRALFRAVVDAYCSSVVGDALDEYSFDVIGRRLLEKGHKIAFVTIGEEPART